jgi:hypothetical protein
MACFALAMRNHDRDEPAIGVMISAMAAPPIEQHKALVTQERIHLSKPNIAGRIAHLFNELRSLTHAILPNGSERIRYRYRFSTMNVIDAATAMVALERTVAAVKGDDAQESKFARALATLKSLSRKEGIPLAIVGGLAAIHHGYERFTKDIDIVVLSGNLDILIRVAPHYGIKVIWKDPEGWHKLECEGVPIDVVPEGRKPRKDAPMAIPGPEQLGVREGADYAGIAGWMETKLGSYRVQDRADVVQVIKVTTPAALKKVRKHLGKTHAIYLQRLDELVDAAREEKEQERERGGGKSK